MTYDEWLAFREQWFRDNPVQDWHLRLDIELCHSRLNLDDVPVEFNPHCGHHERYLYYQCDDWTIRTDIATIEPTPHNSPTYRMIVESGHVDKRPRITLMSTSSSIVHESWAAKKNWNDFAYFGGKYLRMTWNEYFGQWPGGRMWGLPFQDRHHYTAPKPRVESFFSKLLPSLGPSPHDIMPPKPVSP